jgi:hypothetical protein
MDNKLKEKLKKFRDGINVKIETINACIQHGLNYFNFDDELLDESENTIIDEFAQEIDNILMLAEEYNEQLSRFINDIDDALNNLIKEPK